MNASWGGVITNIYASQRFSYEPYNSWHWTNVNRNRILTAKPRMRSVVGTSDHLFNNNVDFIKYTCNVGLPVEFIVATGIGHDINAYYNYTLPSGTKLGLDTFKFHAETFGSTFPLIAGEFKATAVRGQSFSHTFSASGAGTWSATGLPLGLAIDSSTGAISGSVDVSVAEATYLINLQLGTSPAVVGRCHPRIKRRRRSHPLWPSPTRATPSPRPEPLTNTICSSPSRSPPEAPRSRSPPQTFPPA